MRITNKIMQNNNLNNINTNKIYQDRLSTQMSSQKKINRPSDDPVVAIRALRLRSNVTEVTQYYTKNIPDAESWLSITEDALKNLAQVVTTMIEQCTKGANGDLKTEDRQIILEQLQALSDEVYSTGNADFAGRYVFTGFRTDTSLSFINAETKNYTITEQLNNGVIDSVTKVKMGDLLDFNSTNYNGLTVTENDVDTVSVNRIQLAYKDCYVDMNDMDLSIKFQQPRDDGAGGVVTDANGNVVYDPVEWSFANGDIEVMHSYERDPDPYTYVSENDDAIVFVPETGELLLGENRYQDLMKIKDDVTTPANEGEIQVTYQKENWLKGDLRPEHYFYCEADGIEYNTDYLNGIAEKQSIEYDVGFNQSIRVNSTADECFQHGIGRTTDDLVSAMQEVLDIEAVKANIEKLLETASGANADKLKEQLKTAEKAYTLAKDKCQKMFEAGITTFQGYLDDTNLSMTNCGTRSSKLALIKSRSQTQKTTFETLKSENEDVDITEVAIQLTSAELTYEAALMATGKVTQTTLLNFI